MRGFAALGGLSLLFCALGCGRSGAPSETKGTALAAVAANGTPDAPVAAKDAGLVSEPTSGSTRAITLMPAPVAKPIRVLVGGDLLPHRPSLIAPESIKGALAPLGTLFKTADMVVANYEAATGEVERKGFRLAYAAPADWLKILPAAGIGAVTVANNHACDLGLEGVEATLAATSDGGPVAIGGDAKDPWTPRTLTSRDGKRVCAVAWTTLINAEGGCARTVRLAVAPLGRKGLANIDTAMARARSECDATIAIIHGGDEYKAQTHAVIEQAKRAADAGAAAVVIHHPHVASPIELHATKEGRAVPIFASVGNLVSNQGESWKPPMYPVMKQNRRLVCVNGWTRLGVIADLAFSWPDGAGRAPRLDWGYHLTWTENEHADDKSIAVPKIETRLLDATKDAAIVERLSEDARGPVDLFDDPCWVERPVYTPGDAASDPRCVGGGRRESPRSASPTMASRAKRRH